ncbi:3-oxoacyl-ACP synthase [Psychromonas sp. B3M02]|uniref:3-oxoacyl-ACP synthase III family protein n=1 Tax=Psychromonas sp. B3M02 TaxID=2267226 RepID=UPI000DEAB16A|nr:3-oxoacyl-[acyl-carrier-protein] synthase III C-terminal domain-containing protein [Psychromonas sp. B3M02]RBW46813.1 3-oxoacyl-ACP synthase [Psychromonas sp. B3M02]
MAVTFAPNELNLLAINAFLPPQQVTNQTLFSALNRLCGKTAQRKAKIIAKRLGIEGRYLVRDLAKPLSACSPTSIDMSHQALTAALTAAGLTANDLGYLLSHTCTPHTQVPPNASWIADKLGLQSPYLELRQACTGFANALQIASAFSVSDSRPLAIVGCETGSVYFDINNAFISTSQMVNYMQMGDGCAAAIVQQATKPEQRLSDIYMGQIGHGKAPGFYLDGGSKTVGTGEMARFHHNTQAVKDNGESLFELGLQAVLSRGYQLDDFNYILPHQANGYIDTMIAKKLNIAPHKVINDAKDLGNLGSAAIWVSLARLVNSGKLNRGDKVMVLGAEATKYLYGGFVYTH